MVDVLEFIFESPWRFLGVCVFMAIIAYWKPIDITILNVRFKENGDEDNTITFEP